MIVVLKEPLPLHRSKTSNLLTTSNMFSIEKKLSKSIYDGLREVLVRVNINRDLRPRMRSGVLVNPEYFVDGEIVIPRGGRMAKVNAVQVSKAKSELDAFCSRLLNILSVSYGKVEGLGSEWLKMVVRLDEEGKIEREGGLLTYDAIRKAVKKECGLAKMKKAAYFKDEQSFYDMVKVYCQEKQLSEKRLEGYKVLCRIIARFESFQRIVEGRKGFAFDVDRLKPDDIRDLKEYMRNEGNLLNRFPGQFERIKKEVLSKVPYMYKNHPDRGITNKTDNFMHGLLCMLSSVIRWMRETKGLTNNNPMAGIDKGHSVYVKRPVYITVGERKMLEDLDLSDNEYLACQRDIFVFQCFVGCRYGDMTRLKHSNVHEGVLEYVPSKTRNHELAAQPRIPLSNKALALIGRWEGEDWLNSDRLFPFVGLHQYNEAIKELFRMAGLTRNVFVYDTKLKKEVQKPLNEVVTSHMARRTFVGTLYKQVKDPALIGSMSGHSMHSKSFARYRDIDDEDLRAVIELIQ